MRTTLGRILFRQNKPRAATREFELALSQLSDALGEKNQSAADVKHPAIAEVLAAQAETQTSSKAKFKFNDAINMTIDALGDYGRTHPRVARWHYRLAKIDLAAGDLKGAQASLATALKIQAEKQPRHPHYAESLRLHAQLLRKIDPDDPAADEAEGRADEVMKNHKADEADAGN